MVENNNVTTIPGFTLHTQNFSVEFVAGFQKGMPSNVLEYETNHINVMAFILEALEKFPTSVSAVEKVLTETWNEVIRANAPTSHGKTTVKIEENLCFPPPLGSQKSLKIFISDEVQPELYFDIKKKSSMKTLKELGAAAVVENMKEEIDIKKLEIPVTLFDDLREAFRNDFGAKYHKDKVNRCFNHKEGVIVGQPGYYTPDSNHRAGQPEDCTPTKKNDFALVAKLKLDHPSLSTRQGLDYMKELRRSNNGKLSGMRGKDMLNNLEGFIQRDKGSQGGPNCSVCRKYIAKEEQFSNGVNVTES